MIKSTIFHHHVWESGCLISSPAFTNVLSFPFSHSLVCVIVLHYGFNFLFPHGQWNNHLFICLLTISAHWLEFLKSTFICRKGAALEGTSFSWEPQPESHFVHIWQTNLAGGIGSCGWPAEQPAVSHLFGVCGRVVSFSFFRVRLYHEYFLQLFPIQ